MDPDIAAILASRGPNHYDDLGAAVRFGYAEDVARVFSKFKKSDEALQGYRLGNILADAIRYRHVDILKLLLDEGVAVTERAVEMATRKKDTKALDMLFEYGWDINRPLDKVYPPLLRHLHHPSRAQWELTASQYCS